MGVSHVKSVTVADWSGTVTVGNSTGGTVTIAASNLARPSDWNSNHAISLSGSDLSGPFTFGSGLTNSTNATGQVVGFDAFEFFEPFIAAQTNSSLSAPGIGTWYIDNFVAPNGLQSGQIANCMADAAGFKNGAVYSSASTGSISRYQTMNNQLAIYAYPGTTTSALSTTWSADCSIMATWVRQINSTTAGGGTTTGVIITNALSLSFPAQWDSLGGVTYSSTAQSGTTSTSVSTVASTFADNLITGALAYLSGSRMQVWGFATYLPPDEYWMAHMFSSTSSSTGTNYSTGTMFSTQSLLHNLEFVGQAFKRLGQSVSNSSTALQKFHGSVATVSSLPIATIATSDIRNLATNARMYWNLAHGTF